MVIASSAAALPIDRSSAAMIEVRWFQIATLVNPITYASKGVRAHRRRNGQVANQYHVAVMVQQQEARSRAEEESPGGGVPRVSAHWYTLHEASSLLRISEPALRRRIADGSVSAIRSGRNWRILLPGEPKSAAKEPEETPDNTGPRGQVSESVALQSIEPLVGLVHDLQRQSLALAGQIGYLQNQLSQTQGQLESLRERAENAVEAPTANKAITPEEYQRALDEIATLRSVLASWQSPPPAEPSRRGWRFWRRRRTS